MSDNENLPPDYIESLKLYNKDKLKELLYGEFKPSTLVKTLTEARELSCADPKPDSFIISVENYVIMRKEAQALYKSGDCFLSSAKTIQRPSTVFLFR